MTEWIGIDFERLKYVVDPLFPYRGTGYFWGREYESTNVSWYDREARILWLLVSFNPRFALTHLLPGRV